MLGTMANHRNTRAITDHTIPLPTEQLRREFVATLDIAPFDNTAYHDYDYLKPSP